MRLPNRRFAIWAGVVGTALSTSSAAAPADEFTRREADWRNGAIVYQVLIDRFVPSANLEAKRSLYPAPKVLRKWSEPSLPGVYLEDAKLNSQELDFWGGDIQSARTKLNYIRELGADVLYLNPIHLAYTNHKYDALDFQKISPEYGNREDFKSLAADAHALGMKVVLDGVFNHMGRNSSQFKDAYANPKSQWRDWFAIGQQFKGGARVWTGYQNLPELNLENPAVRKYIYASKDSVVRSYLRDGADGWRLDTAFELGHQYLSDLTRAAHQEKSGSLVVGEIANYPGEWLRSMDAVMNFSLRQIVIGLAEGEILPLKAARMTDRLIGDAGIEPMLKSWMVIDNHDIPRMASQFPDLAKRRLVQTLQFTLPGAPNVYYGSELGMSGGPDPENRGPMQWELVRSDNPELVWSKQLIDLRKKHRALRVGNFRVIDADALYAFERYTNKVLDTMLVVANAGTVPVTERLMIASSSLMDGTPLVNLLVGDGREVAAVNSGFITVTVPAQTALVLGPVQRDYGGYSRYKRVQ